MVGKVTIHHQGLRRVVVQELWLERNLKTDEVEVCFAGFAVDAPEDPWKRKKLEAPFYRPDKDFREAIYKLLNMFQPMLARADRRKQRLHNEAAAFCEERRRPMAIAAKA